MISLLQRLYVSLPQQSTVLELLDTVAENEEILPPEYADYCLQTLSDCGLITRKEDVVTRVAPLSASTHFDGQDHFSALLTASFVARKQAEAYASAHDRALLYAMAKCAQKAAAKTRSTCRPRILPGDHAGIVRFASLFREEEIGIVEARRIAETAGRIAQLLEGASPSRGEANALGECILSLAELLDELGSRSSIAAAVRADGNLLRQ